MKTSFSEIIYKKRTDCIDNTKITNDNKLLFLPNTYYESSNEDKIYLFGVTIGGKKVCLILENIDLHVLIKLDKKSEILKLESSIIVEKYNFHKFQTNPSEYIKKPFETKYERSNFIRNYSDKYDLANDDPNYFNLMSTIYKFNSGYWNAVKNFTILNNNQMVQNCDLVVSCDINDYVKEKSEIYEDNTIVMQWDIETYSTVSHVATANDIFTVINISCVFFFINSTEPLVRYSISLGKCNILQDAIIIECNTEKEVIEAFINIIYNMRPDIISAFNGSNYDWPMIKRKIKDYSLLEKFKSLSCIKLSKKTDIDSLFNSITIKMDSENNHSMPNVLKCAGILDIDSMGILLSVYPKMEVNKLQSLNFFLISNNLQQKEDMNIKKMFKIYERSQELKDKTCHCNNLCNYCNIIRPILDCQSDGNFISDKLIFDNNLSINLTTNELQSLTNFTTTLPLKTCCYCRNYEESLKNMTLVAKYCIVDSIRPQEIFVKRNLWQDKRELSNLSHVSLFDSFYRAGGMKVKNLISFYCNKRNMAFKHKTGKKNTKDNYPGAWVFPPKTGLDNVRPITGMDVNSLYPSLMMTYNLSPDMIVTDEKQKEDLEDLGYDLYKIGPFEYTNDGETKICEGYSVRHNEIITEKDIYAKKVLVKDDKIITEPFREKLPGEKMGIFAFIVKKLIDKRAPLKKKWVELSTQVEFNGNANSNKELNYALSKLEMKQKAIKILANTFYGESGNFNSSVYSLQVAGGITHAGQMTIKEADRFCSELKYETRYGDTDSLYLRACDELYKECDDEYNKSEKSKEDKMKYWTKMVKITMDDMSALQTKLANHFVNFNGTNYIKFAYEEVGFPSVLCGKKKYYFIPHIKNINFEDYKPFIKGIETVKQGKAKSIKNMGENFMKDSLSITNELSLIDLAKNAIVELLGGGNTDDKKSFIDSFILSARYKPYKQNISVNSFMERMINQYKETGDQIYAPVETDDKFNYLICNTPRLLDLKGNFIPQKLSDFMEFVPVFYKEKKNLNLVYYAKNYAVNILSRFIASDPLFKPSFNYDPKNKDSWSIYDKTAVKNASKFLNSFVDNFVDEKEFNMNLTIKKKELRNAFNILMEKIFVHFYTKYGNYYLLLIVLDDKKFRLSLESLINKNFIPKERNKSQSIIEYNKYLTDKQSEYWSEIDKITPEYVKQIRDYRLMIYNQIDYTTVEMNIKVMMKMYKLFENLLNL